MIHEIAEIDILEGQHAAFEKALEQAASVFKAAKGCVSLDVQRMIERPDTYRLVIGWQTLENHTVDFRGSEGFQEWRRIAGPFFKNPPRVEHVTHVMKAF
jgi:quinol monooxygenase YgiN